MKLLIMDVVGVLTMLSITIAGIIMLFNDNLVIGWTWLICGSGVLIIAMLDIWRRYK